MAAADTYSALKNNHAQYNVNFTHPDSNNTRMNQLLNEIGKRKKSLFNRITFTQSKSEEFLDIVERKINSINLKDISKDSIEIIKKKIDELNKIFTKLQEFSIKIQQKNDSTLKNRLTRIYFENKNIFTYFSLQIKLKGEKIDDINTLEKLQKFFDRLIDLNNLLQNISSNEKLYNLREIERNKGIINERIKSLEKKNQPIFQTESLIRNNMQNLTAKYEQLKQSLVPNKNKGIRQINNNEKTELSKYIIDLATRIYETAKITQDSNKFNQLKQMLYDLRDKYLVIFIEPHKQNGQLIQNIQGVNQEKLVYNNLEKKYQELGN